MTPPDTTTTAAATQLKRDYRDVFSTEQGKNVLRDLMDEGGIFGHVSHVDEHGQVDPYRMAAAEGRRELVLHILSESDQRPATAQDFMDAAHGGGGDP